MTETGDEIAAGDALYASDPAAWWEAEAAKPRPTPEPAGVPCPECPGGTGLVWTVGRTSLTCPACGHWQTGPSAQRAAEQHAGQRLRKASVAPRRASRLRNRGAYVVMSGEIGVTRDPKYRRRRTIGQSSPIHLAGPVMGEILAAYEAGNDDQALDLLREALDDEYAAGITFEDLDSLEFLRDDPTGQ